MGMCNDFTTAFKLLEEKTVKAHLSTGNIELDNLIGRGIEPGVFYLFYGTSESSIDEVLHQIMVNALGTRRDVQKVVYLNCGNYRENKTLLNVSRLTYLLKTYKLDLREYLEQILVVCAFSKEQVEQVVESVRHIIEEVPDVKLLVIHNVAKLYKSQGRSIPEEYKSIPRLQRSVLRLWQICAARGIAVIASCRPSGARHGELPRPEVGRYLSHEANVIVYFEKIGGLFPAQQIRLLKHPAKSHGKTSLNGGGRRKMGRITVPFKMKLKQELESLKGFRDALRDLAKQAAYDEIVDICTLEQGALSNADIPTILDAMLLTGSVDNRSQITRLLKRVDALEETVRRLERTLSLVDYEKTEL